LIERTSKKYILELLSRNYSNWKILDIGCNRDAIEFAQYVADIDDYSKFYPTKQFFLIKDKKLPFTDKQFDFVYASHVIEHVLDVSFFINEIQRISSKGYIELPSMLEDNIILSDNSMYDHKWFFQFDDVNKVLLVEKKKQLLEPFISHGVLFDNLRKNFRQSLVLELFWETEIDFKFQNFSVTTRKLNFRTIFKKYLSYKIRNNKIFTILLFLLVFFVIYLFFL